MRCGKVTLSATALWALVALAALFGGCGGSGESETRPKPRDSSIESVGDRPIHPGEFERFLMREAGVAPGELEPEVQASFRAELIAEILLARAAVREGLAIDDEALADEIARLEAIAPDVDADTLADEARRRALARAYEMQVIAPRVEVPGAEIERMLEASGRQRRVKHVVFRQLMAPSRAEAEAARRRITREGEAFEAVAREVSLEASGGQPQQRRLDELPEEAADALTRLREGRVSEPLAIAGVYYVFKLETVTHDPDPGRERERREVHDRLLRAAFEEQRHAALEALAAEEGITTPTLPEPMPATQDR